MLKTKLNRLKHRNLNLNKNSEGKLMQLLEILLTIKWKNFSKLVKKDKENTQTRDRQLRLQQEVIQ